jgi:hypothetical protein
LRRNISSGWLAFSRARLLVRCHYLLPFLRVALPMGKEIPEIAIAVLS